MSFFGSLITDITRPIGRAITGFASGGFAGAASGLGSGIVSDFTGSPAPGAPPRLGGPAVVNLPGPINRGGGTVSLPFVGPTHIPGPVGSFGQGFQNELSNLTGVPVAGSGSSQVKTYGSGLKQVIQYRATQPGYVVVHLPNGQVQAMPKEVARHLVNPDTGKRLWKPTPKPAISAHDMKVAKEYKRVEKKLKKLGGDLDLKTEHKYAHRARTSRSRSKQPVQEAIVIKE